MRANSPMEQALQFLGEAKMSTRKKPHSEGKDIEDIVENAVKRMAKEQEIKKVLALKPGLHVRRYRALPDGIPVYTVVRVIGCDRGEGMEYKIYTLNCIDGEDELELTHFEIESSVFMEIRE